MKIVHSFWSKPLLNAEEKDVSFGGWRQMDYFYMSWILSCLTFSRFYTNVALVTDKTGYNLLVNKLHLPYTNVHVVLDELENYPGRLWALGKIYAYKIQKSPFIHVDGDVFIWEPFGASIEKASLIAQQSDDTNGHYKLALEEAKNYNISIPKIISEDLHQNPNFKAYNAGILGGHDIDFFQSFCKEVFKMIDTNSDKYAMPLGDTHYALLYEQLLFSSMARQTNRKVTCLIDNSSTQGMSFKGSVSNFRNKYHESYKYVHIVGAKKKFLANCYELRNQLEVEFPEYLERLDKLIKDNQMMIN